MMTNFILLRQCLKFQSGSYGIRPISLPLVTLVISRALAHRHLVAQEALTLESVDVQDNQVAETRMIPLSSLGNVRECLLCICNCKIAWDVEERNLQKWLGLHQAVQGIAVVQAQVPVRVGVVQAVQTKVYHKIITRQPQDLARLSKHMKIHASPQQVITPYLFDPLFIQVTSSCFKRPQDNQSKESNILDSAWFVLSFNKNTSRFVIIAILMAA